MLKNLTLLQNSAFRKIWFAFHALAALAFASAFFMRKGAVSIDTDLFNMLPKPALSEALNAADDKLTEITAQNVFILVSHIDFETAKRTAETVYAELKDSPRFKSITLYQDASLLESALDFAQRYRWNLLDDAAVSSINMDGGAERFAQDALTKAYSAFTIASLDSLERDPFMLGDSVMQHYLSELQDSGTKMSPKAGMLASFANDRWYVMIRGTLSKKGAALASKANAVVQIRQVCDPLEKDGIRFVYSGTPFHSYKSSSNASREITVISAVSLLAVLSILLLIFRSHLPIVYSAALIAVSTATAALSTLAVFGKMHILTLVFGTSLIGSCIDYSLHYFVNWKGNSALQTGMQVRNHLLKGLLLSMFSTVLCYFALVFAPFNLLRQMSVFSMTGIFSSFLTVICIFPHIPMPSGARKVTFIHLVKTPAWYNPKAAGRVAVTGMFVAAAAMLTAFHKNLTIENKVDRLYRLEGREFENEKEAAGILQYNPSGWFVVSGESAEELLQHEERLAAELKRLNHGKAQGGFVCTSAFIPSRAKQAASRQAAAKLLPLAHAQYEALGFDAPYAERLQVEFDASAADFVSPEKEIPTFLENAVSSTWIGQIGKKYYSVILPVSVTDEAAYRALAEKVDGAYFINKMHDMNNDLDRLSRTILTLFAVVYLILFAALKFAYTWKQTFKILSVPLLIVLFEAAVFAAAGIKLEFFSITGIILVFGLGLDYVIYMIENEKRKDQSENAKLEPFAIALSFVTTAVSFGALSLSSFVPVRMMGLSILIGITTAYVCTFFYTRAEF